MTTSTFSPTSMYNNRNHVPIKSEFEDGNLPWYRRIIWSYVLPWAAAFTLLCLITYGVFREPEVTGLQGLHPTELNRKAEIDNTQSWLLAAIGTCGNMNITNTPVVSDDITFSSSIEFEFHTKDLIKFTDAPYHQAHRISGIGDESDELSSSKWTQKNVAVLVEHAGGYEMATYKIQDYRSCDEQANHTDCVHYTGYVSAYTSQFDPAGEDLNQWDCQLFVDSSTSNAPCYWNDCSLPAPPLLCPYARLHQILQSYTCCYPNGTVDTQYC